MKYPKFKLKARCVKCGEVLASVDFKSGLVIETGVGAWDFYYLPEDYNPEQVIMRTCVRCGFKWLETPLDIAEFEERKVKP